MESSGLDDGRRQKRQQFACQSTNLMAIRHHATRTRQQFRHRWSREIPESMGIMANMAVFHSFGPVKQKAPPSGLL
jgi:hypothetical protein